MGVKQSKRSVDITETSTKGEIEGFGNEGKVEKIFDGAVEKVAANGHVDGDLQNGGESHQNGMEPVQNGEAATVAAEKVTDKKDSDESPVEGTVNGTVENGEVNGEAEKTEDKKEKKKKEKVMKKKFSFRNFSFSKKDKAKPPKEEKTAGKVEEPGIEEAPNAENKEEVAAPSDAAPEQAAETADAEKKPAVDTVVLFSQTKQAPEGGQPSAEKVTEATPAATSDDLPPPLPASPPPSEPVIGNPASDAQEDSRSGSGLSETLPGEAKETESSAAAAITETAAEVVKDAEQIVVETGKQIEEKATSLLKTVEGRAEETIRTAEEFISQKTDSVTETVQNALGSVELGLAEGKPEEAEMKMEDFPTPPPVDISTLGSLTKAEDSTDKHEEGAGESLAEVPKDLEEEVDGDKMEAINPDSLEVSAGTIPPPAEETATGE